MTETSALIQYGLAGIFPQKMAVSSCKKTREPTIDRALIFEMGFLVDFGVFCIKPRKGIFQNSTAQTERDVSL
jgi:hypothetical protein